MSEETAISFENVYFTYGSLPVLEAINLSLSARSITCVVGPNGGGKSTMLKLMLGLLRPQKGFVSIFGDTPRKARLRMGYMPQTIDIDPLFPITVEKMVSMGRLRGSMPGWLNREDRAKTDQSLAELELEDYRQEQFINLSGGLKQRVLIARALVSDPDILLLDEPTAMVDAHVEARLLKKIKDLHKKMTILLVSHDVAFVSEIVEQVVCVNRTLEIHPVEAVENAHIHDLYGESVRSVRHDEHLGEH